jgi:hypothetical protein
MIVRNTSKGQLVALPFVQDQLAASQTNAQLTMQDSAVAVDGISMPFDGEVVGISYDLSAAATAGSLTVGATVDGTEDADSTVTITTAKKGYQRIQRRKIRFKAGAQLGVEITTSATWDGTTADLVVTLWVLLQLEGV